MCETPQSMLYCASAKLFKTVVLHKTFVEFCAQFFQQQTYALIQIIDADYRTGFGKL